jgi:hypothetical protein
MTDQRLWMKHANALSAALLIIFLGPPLGATAVSLWSFLGIGWLGLGYSGTGSSVFDCYMLGGVQSTICAIIVYKSIQNDGQVSLSRWFLLTAIAVLTSAIAFHLVITQNLKSDLFPKSLGSDLIFFGITTFFASLVLWGLMMSLGRMIKRNLHT